MNGQRPYKFPFHFGSEAELYTFYRIPKLLFEEPIFSGLSTEAKLLYGILLDRMQLSVRNRWVDECGRIYIYFKIESVMRIIGCGNKKASQLLAELDDKKGIGLITRVRQGLGKPDKIFVHKCVPEGEFQKCHFDMSENVERTSLERSNGHANNTELNNTDGNDTETIYHSEERMEGEELYRRYREYFLERLDFSALLIDYPEEQEELEEILELLVETVSSTRERIRISGEDKPSSIVRSRLMKLKGEHIRYVMMCMRENTTRIRNIRQYLLATLFNAPVTMSHYYASLVNHDLYGKEGE